MSFSQLVSELGPPLLKTEKVKSKKKKKKKKKGFQILGPSSCEFLDTRLIPNSKVYKKTLVKIIKNGQKLCTKSQLSTPN